MNRSDFIKSITGVTGTIFTGIPSFAFAGEKMKVRSVGMHVWIYAANQPGFDVSGILPQIFSDVKYAGFDSIETMQHPLRSAEKTRLIAELIEEHDLPLLGTSYGGAMWDKSKHNEILEDVEKIMENMEKVDARTFGTSVGAVKGRKKTEEELDAQAELLQKLMKVGKKRGVVVNLHNHTYEVENNMHDLRGTLKRIPEIKLGPDLNWLLRAGVDPIDFLKEFKNNIVFLHLRDQLENGKWPESLGEGDVDYGKIAETMDDIDFKGDVVVELAHENNFEPTRPIRESLKMSREFLQKEMGI
ncbi:MAG: sugar phosphate isomerase/epimerase family protein [Prolixibacteraceae bacterium]